MSTRTRAAPKKNRPKKETLADAFARPASAQPLSGAFDKQVEDRIPPVVLMDRASLALLRPTLAAAGWPRGVKPGDALAKAQKVGAVSLAPMIERYGAQTVARAAFIVLPVLDGCEEKDAHRTFRAAVHDGVVTLYPPGADTSAAPPRSSPVLAPNIIFFPFAGRQEDALAAAEFEVLFGGAKGGGKSEYVVIAALRQIDKPAYKALIFRKTEKALEELLARAKAIYSQLGGNYRVDDMTFTFPTGAKIEMGFAEVEADTDRYQGREFAFVGGDEFAQVADPKVRTRLISECRSPDPDVIRMIRWTANPIGPGVALLKRLFIALCGQDGSRIHYDTYHIEGIGEVRLARRFIPSRVTDNPVYRDDPIYMATLHSLTPRMRRLLLHGDWSAALGVVLDELSRTKHWIGMDDPRHPKGVPDHWPLLGFLDWGFAHRWCFTVVALDEEKNAWVVDTLWGSRDQVPAIAARIHTWVGEDGRAPRPIWASKLCFAERKVEGLQTPTYAEQFSKARLPMMQANEGPNTRVVGLNNLRDWIAWQTTGPEGKEGEPRLRFLATHGNEILFQQLEQMVPDPDNPEDALKVDYDPDADEDGINISGDDGYDALKMFALVRPIAARSPPKKEQKRNQYDHAFDKMVKQRQRAFSPGGRGF